MYILYNTVIYMYISFLSCFHTIPTKSKSSSCTFLETCYALTCQCITSPNEKTTTKIYWLSIDVESVAKNENEIVKKNVNHTTCMN